MIRRLATSEKSPRFDTNVDYPFLDTRTGYSRDLTHWKKSSTVSQYQKRRPCRSHDPALVSPSVSGRYWKPLRSRWHLFRIISSPRRRATRSSASLLGELPFAERACCGARAHVRGFLLRTFDQSSARAKERRTELTCSFFFDLIIFFLVSMQVLS